MLKSIFQAAEDNDLGALNSILDNHPTMATCVDEATGWTPLHFAAKHNTVAAAEILLQHGADPNAQDEQGVSPLRLAGGEAIVRLLRRHGAHFSTNCQLLKEAQKAKRLVQLTYDKQKRTIRIIQLGLTSGEERCFAHQGDAPGPDVEAGLRCFRVHLMTDLEQNGPEAGDIPEDPSRKRACVGLVYEDF